MTREYVKNKAQGKLYNKDQFGYWEFTKEEYASYEASESTYKAEEPRREALAKIVELETIPRRVREMGIRLGDQYSIDEESAINKQRKKLTGE